MATKNSATYPIYEGQVGALGSVTFFRDPETNTYCFMFFNGVDYTPLAISEGAAFYVWAFIGCEHPDCTTMNFTTAKKAGCGKPKKRPSLTTKKKAKSK